MVASIQLAVTMVSSAVTALAIHGVATPNVSLVANSLGSSQSVTARIGRRQQSNERQKDAPVRLPDSRIVASSAAPWHWWGFPNYARYLDTGPPSWPELARRHGHLGRTCAPKTARKQCGAAYVCRHDLCQECKSSRECGEKYKCVQPAHVTSEADTTIMPWLVGSGQSRSMCILRDPVKQWNWREILCTFFIVITAMLSAAAGMGGGGVYVPLLLLLLDFSTKEAVPMSQAMIAGGATVNVAMFLREMQFGRNKINFEVVMMLNPGLAAGVTVGIVFNIISPQWLIVVVLLVTLVLAFQKSWTKGVKQWREETRRRSSKQSSDAQLAEEGSASGGTNNDDVDARATPKFGLMAVVSKHKGSLGLISSCWVAFLVNTMFKAPACSLRYWLQLFGILAACGVFTAAGASTIRAKTNQKTTQADRDEVVVWDSQALWIYPVLAVVSGFLGGFLGIGGGIIMGPLLLEMGLPADVVQGTTAMFVFLSASLATIQFVALGKAMPAYALWFTSWVIVATLLGQTAADYALRRWKRPSVIVLSIAAIIAGSMVMMGAVGTINIVNDITHGSSGMGFNILHLCNP